MANEDVTVLVNQDRKRLTVPFQAVRNLAKLLSRMPPSVARIGRQRVNRTYNNVGIVLLHHTHHKTFLPQIATDGSRGWV